MLRARVVRTKSRRYEVVVCVRQVRATVNSYAENYVALEGGEGWSPVDQIVSGRLACLAARAWFVLSKLGCLHTQDFTSSWSLNGGVHTEHTVSISPFPV